MTVVTRYGKYDAVQGCDSEFKAKKAKVSVEKPMKQD